jgi:hypothetical protein
MEMTKERVNELMINQQKVSIREREKCQDKTKSLEDLVNNIRKSNTCVTGASAGRKERMRHVTVVLPCAQIHSWASIVS